jgi:hypothetical protein
MTQNYEFLTGCGHNLHESITFWLRFKRGPNSTPIMSQVGALTPLSINVLSSLSSNISWTNTGICLQKPPPVVAMSSPKVKKVAKGKAKAKDANLEAELTALPRPRMPNIRTPNLPRPTVTLPQPRDARGARWQAPHLFQPTHCQLSNYDFTPIPQPRLHNHYPITHFMFRTPHIHSIPRPCLLHFRQPAAPPTFSSSAPVTRLFSPTNTWLQSRQLFLHLPHRHRSPTYPQH